MSEVTSISSATVALKNLQLGRWVHHFLVEDTILYHTGLLALGY
jgi:hypothetical protein